MNKKSMLHTAGGAVSALALAAAMSPAHAFDFQVGQNTKATIGAYVKGDVIYNVNEDLGDTVAIGAVNTGAAEDNEVEGKTRIHARQSRFRVMTRTPVQGSDLFTRIETDFFGGSGNEVVSNSTSMRIRHAYGEWNGILAGQTWSNFMPLIALPPTLDFGGPAGYIFNRQGQVRYTVPAGPGKLSLAVENPESAIAGTTNDNDPLPDLTAQYQGTAGPAKFALSGVVAFLETDDGNNDESTTGYGVMLAASANVGGVTIGGNAGYNDGANRYIYNSVAPFQNGYVDANGDIETVPQIDLLGYVDVPITPMVSGLVSVGYSMGDADDETAAQAAGFRDTAMTVHANVRFKPIAQVTYGLEYQHARVEEYNGDDGNANRVQFSATYSF